MLSSATSVLGYNKFNDSYWFVKHQLLYGFLPGLVFFAFFAYMDYRRYKKYIWFFYAAAVLLLVVVFAPGIGSSLGTRSRSWIKIGFFSFQPAEVVKLLFLLFLAAWLERREERIKEFKAGFLSLLGLIFIPAVLLVAQPDVGTLMIFLMIIFWLVWAAGADIKHLFLAILMALASLAALIKVAPYRLARLTAFLHPEADPHGIGYHINQALLAVGSGGWFGLGLGHSRQKFLYLPEVAGDSIFAIMAEELGFVPVALFIFLFVWLFTLILKTGRQAKDKFGYFLCVGAAVWLLGQFFVNMGAMLGLLPLTGLPMPLVSYGGTALMVNMAVMGLVISVARTAYGVGNANQRIKVKSWHRR